ncbi:lycopene cyclase domain-containing protein [Haloplanus rallus]|jgi:lycopene cyclase domain-containing protein|uniref:Lycopene cyclase domain-containing protein n=1 Tax=Haloplanus rallus TaxID=1816183 RepID=A0A6B9F4C7_9EURY|nr:MULTISPECIES: lycopene cyclase domain-containing protein [Haloplanus]QGX95316.1 lycopene cyclase domain-containing protein [Haloplanus rallus]
MTGPTYLQFHLAFLLPAMSLLVATAFASRPRAAAAVRPLRGRGYWSGVAVITVVALVYTTPWDNYLIANGVWSYAPGSTLATLGHAPVEEYLFILVQPWLTALWLSHLSLPSEWPTVGAPIRGRLVGLALAVAVGVGGWAALGTPATFYLGAILAWAAPVLALQWVVGAPQLWARRRLVALGVLVPTTYLCVADRVAIEYGIWVLSERYTTGVTLAGLPVEEALFFLVTNCFVVQGLVLYRWVSDRYANDTAPATGDSG